jgi:hypothetical protein
MDHREGFSITEKSTGPGLGNFEIQENRHTNVRDPVTGAVHKEQLERTEGSKGGKVDYHLKEDDGTGCGRNVDFNKKECAMTGNREVNYSEKQGQNANPEEGILDKAARAVGLKD